MRTRPIAIAAAALWSALGAPASAQDTAPVYASPQAAIEALFGAIVAGDAAAAAAAIHPSAIDLVSSDDPGATAETLDDLAALYFDGYRFVPGGEDAVIFELGDDGWPFPVPLLRSGDGWRFDAEAARAEVVARRIGANELDVIDVLSSYVDIQRDYRTVDHDGDGVMEFASAILSTEGRRDGLYWPGEDSPIGDLAARASLNGFADDDGDEPGRPFAGYFFRVLTAQGETAPGGAMSYLVNGNMVGGHALLAVPAVWGETGVYSFMVGENGIVLQADLGPRSLDAAFGITAFDPDSAWRVVGDESPSRRGHGRRAEFGKVVRDGARDGCHHLGVGVGVRIRCLRPGSDRGRRGDGDGEVACVGLDEGKSIWPWASAATL